MPQNYHHILEKSVSKMTPMFKKNWQQNIGYIIKSDSNISKQYVSRAILPQHLNFIKPNCVNLPPCVAIVKYNTVVHQTTIAILLVQCLQHFHSCCQFFFLQFLILKPNNPDILCPEYRLSNNIYSNLINFLCT